VLDLSPASAVEWANGIEGTLFVKQTQKTIGNKKTKSLSSAMMSAETKTTPQTPVRTACLKKI